jgi:hypothetical protein
VEALWPVVFAGAFGALVGVMMIRFRRPLASFMMKSQKEMFGDRGEPIWRGSTPLTSAFVGACFIVFGVISAAAAVFAPEAF